MMITEITSGTNYSLNTSLEEETFSKTSIHKANNLSSLQSLQPTLVRSDRNSLWNPIKAFFAWLFVKAPEMPKVIALNEGLSLQIEGQEWKRAHFKETIAEKTLIYFPNQGLSTPLTDILIITTYYNSSIAPIDACMKAIDQHKEQGGYLPCYDIYEQEPECVKYELWYPLSQDSQFYLHALGKIVKRDGNVMTLTYTKRDPKDLSDLRSKWDKILDTCDELLLLS